MFVGHIIFINIYTYNVDNIRRNSPFFDYSKGGGTSMLKKSSEKGGSSKWNLS